DGRVETARVATVEPPDRPAVGPGFVGPQRDRTVRAVRHLEDVVVDVAGAVEEGPGARGALERFPVIAAREALLEAAVAHPPGPHVEVEVVDRGARFDRPRGDPGSRAGRHRSLL